MILRRRSSAIPIAATILGIFAVSLFGLGITLDINSLTVIGLVFLVITIFLILVLCIAECRKKYTNEAIEPPVAKEEADPTNGMRRNKSDTDLELISGTQKADLTKMYDEP